MPALMREPQPVTMQSIAAAREAQIRERRDAVIAILEMVDERDPLAWEAALRTVDRIIDGDRVAMLSALAGFAPAFYNPAVN